MGEETEVIMARKKKRQRKHPKFWLGFKIVLLLFLLTILIGGIVFYFKYGQDISGFVPACVLEDLKKGEE